MKKQLSFEEIRSQTAQGNLLPLLRWGQYNSPDKEFRSLCKVYRRLYINEQRTYRALGIRSYEERPQWQKDLITKVSLYNTDINNVILMALNDMSDKENRIVNLKYCAVCLTKTGLAAFDVATETPFFCSNTGEFRRYMSREEWNHVHSVSSAQVITFLFSGVKVQLPEKWQFLWSWKVSDYTTWKAETCCNGGDYAFHETHNIFGRMNAGNLELLDVVRHTTSAEFSYDEANGSFQSNGMAEARFIDIEGDFTLYTQTNNYIEGYVYDKEYSLNQFGQPISWQEAILGNDKEIWRDEEKESPTQMGARIQILKDTFNWEPPKRR